MNKRIPFGLCSKPFYPWLVWGLGAAFFLSEYFARVAPGVMVPELKSTFEVNAASLGALAALFYWPYVFLQIPVGTLVDRFGPHILLTVTSALCALGCFLFGGAELLTIAKVGRFLMGVGAAFAFVGTLKLAAIWFCPSRFGLIAGATQALGMLGAALGAGPLSFLVVNLGWRETMILIGIILFMLAILIGIFVRDKDVGNATTLQPVDKTTSLVQSFIEVLKNPQSWIVSIYAGLLYGPTAAFAELWGTDYLVNVYGLTKNKAALGVSCIFLGWALGGPIAGYISDQIGRRKPILYLSSFCSLFFMSCILYLPHISMTVLFATMFLYGVSNVGVATSYAVSSEINPRHIAGTSMAFTNMASVLLGGIIFQPIIGRLLDMRWQGELVNNAKVYPVEAYTMAMILLPCCFVVSLLLALFIKETKCAVIEQ